MGGGGGGCRLLAGKYVAKEQYPPAEDISVVTAVFDAFWLEQLSTAALLQVSRSCLHQLALAPDTCCLFEDEGRSLEWMDPQMYGRVVYACGLDARFMLDTNTRRHSESRVGSKG